MEREPAASVWRFLSAFLATLDARASREGRIPDFRSHGYDFEHGAGIPGGRWSNGTQIPFEDPYSLIYRPGPYQVRLSFPGALGIVYLRKGVDSDYLALNGIGEDRQASMMLVLESPVVLYLRITFQVESNPSNRTVGSAVNLT